MRGAQRPFDTIRHKQSRGHRSRWRIQRLARARVCECAPCIRWTHVGVVRARRPSKAGHRRYVHATSRIRRRTRRCGFAGIHARKQRVLSSLLWSSGAGHMTHPRVDTPRAPALCSGMPRGTSSVVYHAETPAPLPRTPYRAAMLPFGKASPHRPEPVERASHDACGPRRCWSIYSAIPYVNNLQAEGPRSVS